MHILYVTPEVAPFSNSGRIGEIANALPRALNENGVRVTVLSPFYRDISPERFSLARRIRKLDLRLGGDSLQIGVLDGKFQNCDVSVMLVDHPESFQRDGYYGNDQGAFNDNHRRFYIFAQAALMIIKEFNLKVDVIHTHNWQTAFVPFILQQRAQGNQSPIPTLFTIHDAGDAGLFEPNILEFLQLGYDFYHPEGVEFYGKVSLLKAGLLFSDRVTTFSPTYVHELQTPEFGGGLQGLFQKIAEKMVGIVGGVDSAVWDPETDYRLAGHYQSQNFAGKEACKRAFQSQLGLPLQGRTPLLMVLTQFIQPQGLDLILKILPQLLQYRLQLAFLGPMSLANQARLQELTTAHPAVLVHNAAIDRDQIHRALAGTDAIIIPSYYEPDGLLQLKAMRYGAVPLARAVGGLKDTIVDFDARTKSGTGICFRDFTEEALLTAIQRLVSTYHDRELWAALQRNSMRQNFSWEHTAKKYIELYQQLLSGTSSPHSN